MDRLSERLAFVIRIFALLFVWLIIILYISPELSVLMGLGLFALWGVFFLPLAALQYLNRPKLQDFPPMESSYPSSYAAPQYTPLLTGPVPDDLPPTLDMPAAGSDLVVSESFGQIQPSDAFPAYLPDYVGEELPQHPSFDQPKQGSLFLRSLVLPLAGILTIIAVWCHYSIEDTLAGLGLGVPPAITWSKVTAPEQYQAEQKLAARLALRREGLCESIIAGRIAPANQLTGKAKDGIVYEFTCTHSRYPQQAFSVWVTPDEIPGMPWPSYATFATNPVPMDKAREACEKSLAALLKPLHMFANPLVQAHFEAYNSNIPFRGYLRGYMEQEFAKLGGQAVKMRASCWITPTGEATARLSAAPK